MPNVLSKPGELKKRLSIKEKKYIIEFVIANPDQSVQGVSRVICRDTYFPNRSCFKH